MEELKFIVTQNEIELNRHIDNGNLSVYDITGNLVYGCLINDKVSLPAELKGIYIVSVKEKAGVSVTKKVIIK